MLGLIRVQNTKYKIDVSKKFIVFGYNAEFKMTKFKVGDYVGWNSEAGHVKGTIVRIHTKNFLVNGYTRHCSPEDPQYEIKSNKTDHIAYHRGSALHLVPKSR